MKRLFLLVCVIASVAIAGGIALTDLKYDLACAAGGSPAVYVQPTTYLMRVMGEDSSLCLSETANPDGGTVCGAGDAGIHNPFPQGTVMLLEVQRGGRYASCDSASGSIHLTQGQ